MLIESSGLDDDWDKDLFPDDLKEVRELVEQLDVDKVGVQMSSIFIVLDRFISPVI